MVRISIGVSVGSDDDAGTNGRKGIWPYCPTFHIPPIYLPFQSPFLQPSRRRLCGGGDVRMQQVAAQVQKNNASFSLSEIKNFRNVVRMHVYFE